jgi:hypothetical protein
VLKAMLASTCLALATATPSTAQSYDSSVGTGNIVPFYGQAAQAGAAEGARKAFARVVRPGARQARNAYARSFLEMPAFDEPGDGFGTDPDPNIRFQLHRESLQGRW